MGTKDEDGNDQVTFMSRVDRWLNKFTKQTIQKELNKNFSDSPRI